MTLDKLAEDYKKVLDFICICDQIHDAKKFYEVLDGFWRKEFKATPLIVYSVPLTTEKIEKKHCRSFWNKDKIKSDYSKNEIKIFLDLIVDQKIPESEWVEIKQNDDYLYIFDCGKTEKQKFYGAFRVKEQVNLNISSYMAKYLSGFSLKLSKLGEAKKIQSLVHTDEVTGIYNQRKFITDIEEAIERNKAHDENFSVLFIDIDHFKSVNDGHGHLVGTQLLCDVASILKSVVRETDLCYRYGGDEFVILVPDTVSIDAKMIGLRLLKAISEKTFYVSEDEGMSGEQEFKLSVSVGIAGFPEDAQNKKDIVAIADKMMYLAKQSGRGRVCHAGELFVDDKD